MLAVPGSGRACRRRAGRGQRLTAAAAALAAARANRLVAGAPGATTREDLEQIIAAADRARALTRALLAFAGLVGSGPSLVDPGQAIRDLEPRLRALTDAGVAIDLRPDPKAIHVIGRRRRVRPGDHQPGHQRARCDARRRHDHRQERVPRHRSEEAERHGAHAGCYAEVSVADTGSGIAAGVLGHICDPFFTKGPASTGLGLATVRGVVEHAGGWIDVQTEIGFGTTLRMVLLKPEASGAGGPVADGP